MSFRRSFCSSVLLHLTAVSNGGGAAVAVSLRTEAQAAADHKAPPGLDERAKLGRVLKGLQSLLGGHGKSLHLGDHGKQGTAADISHTTLASDVLQPFVGKVASLLKRADDTSLSEGEKKAVLAKADAAVEEVAVQMKSRGEQLLEEERQQKTNLLLGVLLSRKNLPLARQYEVFEDEVVESKSGRKVVHSEFWTLPVVKWLLKNRGDGADQRPLVVVVGEWLDAHAAGKVDAVTSPKLSASKPKPAAEQNDNEHNKAASPSDPPIKSPAPPAAKVVEARDVKPPLVIRRPKNEMPAEGSMTEKEMVEKMLEQKIQEMSKKFAAAREAGNMTHVEIAHHAGNIKAMQKALKAVKDGDPVKLQEAQQELLKSMRDMQRMQEHAEGEQAAEHAAEADEAVAEAEAGAEEAEKEHESSSVGEAEEGGEKAKDSTGEEAAENSTPSSEEKKEKENPAVEKEEVEARGPKPDAMEVLLQLKNRRVQNLARRFALTVEDCPYCKAQCFEKCHTGGHSYVQCLGTCAEVGN